MLVGYDEGHLIRCNRGDKFGDIDCAELFGQRHYTEMTSHRKLSIYLAVIMDNAPIEPPLICNGYKYKWKNSANVEVDNLYDSFMEMPQSFEEIMDRADGFIKKNYKPPPKCWK